MPPGAVDAVGHLTYGGGHSESVRAPPAWLSGEGTLMDIFTLTCDKLPADTRVIRLSGHEAISQLYGFTIDLAIPGDEGLTFDMADAVDATATLEINDVQG